MTIKLPLSVFAFLAATQTFTSAQNTTTPSDVNLNFNCSTFARQINGQDAPYNTYVRAPSSAAAPSIRVSKAVTCSSNAIDRDPRCQIQPYAYMNLTGTSNITTITDPTVLQTMLRQGLRDHGASASSSNVRLQYSSLGFENSSTTGYVRPGQAAYFVFRPNMMCYEGVVQALNASCGQDDPDVQRVRREFENKPIQICVPTTYKTGRKNLVTKLEGAVELKVVDSAEAQQPGMEKSPFESNRTSPTSQPPPPGVTVGAAGRVGIGNTLGIVVAVIMSLMIV